MEFKQLTVSSNMTVLHVNKISLHYKFLNCHYYWYGWRCSNWNWHTIQEHQHHCKTSIRNFWNPRKFPNSLMFLQGVTDFRDLAVNRNPSYYCTIIKTAYFPNRNSFNWLCPAYLLILHLTGDAALKFSIHV